MCLCECLRKLHPRKLHQLRNVVIAECSHLMSIVPYAPWTTLLRSWRGCYAKEHLVASACYTSAAAASASQQNPLLSSIRLGVTISSFQSEQTVEHPRANRDKAPVPVLRVM